MRQLIDKNEILSFPREDYSGFANFAYGMINKNNLDDRFDDAYQLCEDILDGLMNAVETTEIIEERETTICYLFEYKDETQDYSTYYYRYSCGACCEAVKSDYDDENFKFCPYCGAQYEKIELYKG